jgi:predicted cupin superfamily sugar epimerase
MHPRAKELISTLGLAPHPEGGFYREIFRSTSSVKPDDDRAPRSALTTIYFLLTEDAVSRWHRVGSDEVWHLYEGGPLEVLDLDFVAGSVTRHRLGDVAGSTDRPVAAIAAGHWQAARSLGPYTLVGCTVGPGFDFADFQMMSDVPDAMRIVRAELPELVAWI